ncbi:MAG: TMEM175 family protein [archaeon]|nr:TMEM175 family protein [archaeon]
MNNMPKDLDKIKFELSEKLEFLKENAESEEEIEKLNNFASYLADKYSQIDDEDIKTEKLNRINTGLSYYQRFKKALEKNIDIDPERLMGLTDGIFGMVMTLLVFGIALPELQITYYSTFLSFFSSLAPTIGVTVVSFVLLSSFWIYHHEFIKVNNLNIPYLWLNVFFLICISFVPFTTSLIGHYSHFFLSEVIFGINILLTIISFLLMYHYANSMHFLENAPSKKERNYVYQTFGMIMGLTIVVNLLDFHVSSYFIYLFLLVPVISTIRDIRFKMNE